jgi:MFS transporter, ACS family, glucarate transporter
MDQPMNPSLEAVLETPMNTNGPSRRSHVVACLCSLAFLTILDRVCISSAKSDMSLELGINDNVFGWVFGVFSVGYTLMMVPSGWLADRYGPRKTLTAAVLVWSLLTAATGWVHGIGTLLVVRFLFGLAEAGAFPGAARAISNWLPVQERGLAMGLLNTGSRLGAAFALWGMSVCVLSVGWRLSFILLGIAGCLWAVLWFWWFRDRPILNLRHAAVATSAQPNPYDNPGAKALGPLFRSQSVYVILFQYFASQFTFFICFSWLLPYLKSHYGLSSTMAGMYAAIPLYVGALANWLSGTMVDAIYRRGYWSLSRRLPAMCGFGLATVSVLAAAFMPSANSFILCFSIATFGVDLTLSPSWTACADIGGRHTGTLSGAMNMMGAIGALVSSVLFPVLFGLTGDIKCYFYLAAFLNLAAMAGWGLALRNECCSSEEGGRHRMFEKSALLSSDMPL